MSLLIAAAGGGIIIGPKISSTSTLRSVSPELGSGKVETLFLLLGDSLETKLPNPGKLSVIRDTERDIDSGIAFPSRKVVRNPSVRP